MSLILIHESVDESVDESVAPVGDSLKASFRYLIERLPLQPRYELLSKRIPVFILRHLQTQRKHRRINDFISNE